MSDPQTAALFRLIAEAAERFAAHDSEIAHTLTTTLRHVEARAPSAAPKPHPVCAVLPKLLRQSPDAMARPLADCAALLPWRAPGFGRLQSAVADRIAVTEILGPAGMILHETVRFGALLQSSGVVYPDHSHAAEELYFVIAGAAHWTLDQGAAAPNGAGAFIHHPPGRLHAIETRAEPMLAIWGWTGDIDGASYRAH